MKKISALILSAVIAASVIAGCSNEPATSESSVASSEVIASTGEPATTEAAVQAPKTFEEIYGIQLSSYLDHQYYFEGEAIPITESNFYFVNEFANLCNDANMGYYALTATGHIDLSAECDVEGYDTYGDFYVEQSELYLQDVYIRLKHANEAGVTLSEESKQAINDSMQYLQSLAAGSGLSLDEYIKLYIGPGIDETSFRKILENNQIAYYDYPLYYYNNYGIADYVKTIESVPYIRYALFYVADDADQSEKDKALENATAMKNACKNIDDLSALAATAASEGTVLDQGDIEVAGEMAAEKFVEWALSEERTEGEIDIIYNPGFGYFVVGYIGHKDVYYAPNITYALFFAPDGAEQEVKDQALESATALKDSTASAEDLVYSAGTANDQGSITVLKGDVVSELADWAFDDSRKEGEMDIVYAPEKGYYVVGYNGTQEVSQSYTNNKLRNSVNEEIRAEAYDLHTDDVFLPAPAAPTPTDVPEIVATESAVNEILASDAAETAVAAPVQGGGATTADVLVVVFITLAAVAVAAVIIILIVHAVKNGKKDDEYDDPDDSYDDEDEEDEKPVKKESKPSDKNGDDEESDDPEEDSDEKSDDEANEDEEEKK